MAGNESIIVLGMRGAGKSTYGKIGAQTLGYSFIDLDEVLESQEGCSCGQVIERDGWEGFRKIETEILKKQVEKNPTNTVLSCGGGVIETKEARDFLKEQPIVVNVCSPIEGIVNYLSETAVKATSQSEGLDRRPNYGEEIIQVWERRKPWYEEVRTHDFFWEEGDEIKRIGESFFYRLKNVTTPSVVVPNAAYVHYHAGLESTDGYDAIYTIMEQKSCKDAQGILSKLGEIRRLTRLPLVVDANDDIEVAKIAMRACCEVVQLTVCESDKNDVISLINSGLSTTRFILQIFSNGMPDQESFNHFVEFAQSSDRVIGLKFNISTLSLPNTLELYTKINETKANLPNNITGFSAECRSGDGSVLCNILNSTCGPSLSHDLVRNGLVCDTLGLSRTKLYCLFGRPIQASPSPTMHNTGFKELGLNKVYSICESDDPLKMLSVLKSHRFMGASVTIPHKENVLPMMDELTDAAKKVGAVNTVVRRADGTYLGDNTDWIGIRNLLQTAIPSPKNGKLKALVVGAGGTAFAACYCVTFLEMELVVYNRTLEKAEKVATRFEGTAISDLESLDSVDVVIGTIPASAGFELPNDLIAKCKPIVLDAAYRPRNTKLIMQADAAGCKTFVGVQMLVEQGLAQFERWTGEKAPRKAIEKNVFEYYEKTG